MKIRTVFGVGTARYIGLNLPHFVDEEDHNHDSYMVDSPLCCGIVRWDIRDKIRHHYIHAHSDSITLKRVPFITHSPQLHPNLAISASFSGELATWDSSDWKKLDFSTTRLGKNMHLAINCNANKLCMTSEEGGGLVSVFSFDERGALKFLHEIAGAFMYCEFNSKDNIVAVQQEKINNHYAVKVVEIDEAGKILKETLLPGNLEASIFYKKTQRKQDR